MLLLIINWRFILAMSLAIMARVSFMLINSTLLNIPSLAPAATTITVFITTLSILFILVANHFILNETLSLRQAIGAAIIITGVFVILSK
jgi:drug/metabolite transporter (DMT)-like permease